MGNDTVMSPLKLPTVDFHAFRFGDAGARQRAAREVAQASTTFGFFYLVNHGVPGETIAGGFAAAQEFFSQPLPVRMACKSGQRNQNRGYQPMFDTKRGQNDPDVKESFDMGFPLPADDPDLLAGLPFHSTNSWPELAGFRARTESLYYSMLESGRGVLRAMALALGADENFFVGRCVKPSTNMRLFHYPPQGQNTGIGASAHTDKGIITLLLNDRNGGLHVQAADGQWIDAPPREGALIVNIGQLMTRWTNGRFRSAVHRVINLTGGERYSIPQFHHPEFRALVDPRELPDAGEPKYEPVVAGEFVAESFKSERASWTAAA
jgi:isopenicillin N synthase-like dioxygenase